ncbi:MAG: hypothetical protein WC501_03975 [Candidatus Micrarchaeia archaeon]|jgi:5S rRNA maturation endonuclease (ribonuclease M5)
MSEIEKILFGLKDSVVLVEGKRDSSALSGLGVTNTIEIVGKKGVFEKLKGMEKVVLLFDLDYKGNSLCKKVEEELWSLGIKADTQTRRKLGKILRIKYFEDIKRKYDEFMGE